MDISATTGTPAMAAIVRQLQTINTVRTAVMRQIAESRPQMADLPARSGIGQALGIRI